MAIDPFKNPFGFSPAVRPDPNLYGGGYKPQPPVPNPRPKINPDAKDRPSTLPVDSQEDTPAWEPRQPGRSQYPPSGSSAPAKPNPQPRPQMGGAPVAQQPQQPQQPIAGAPAQAQGSTPQPTGSLPSQQPTAQQQPENEGFLSNLWNRFARNLSGVDENGNLYEGDALKKFRGINDIGMFLGGLGSAIGGDSTGGRLAQFAYNYSAGNQLADEAARAYREQREFLRAALQALANNRRPY